MQNQTFYKNLHKPNEKVVHVSNQPRLLLGAFKMLTSCPQKITERVTRQYNIKLRGSPGVVEPEKPLVLLSGRPS